MERFKRKRLVDKYKVIRSQEPDERGTHLVIHETRSIRGYNCQRVYKGTFKECIKQKNALTEENLKNK